MSWEDKFNKCLHKITEKTTTGLISDEKAERIKNVLRTRVFNEKNTTENSRFRQYVKERKFQLITCPLLGVEYELCVPAKEVGLS
jgi:hypothetical protein